MGLCLSFQDLVSREASQEVLEPHSFFSTQSPTSSPSCSRQAARNQQPLPTGTPSVPYRQPTSAIYSVPHPTGTSAGLPNLPWVKPVLDGLSHYLHLLPTLPGPQARSGLAGWEGGILPFHVHSFQGPTAS